MTSLPGIATLEPASRRIADTGFAFVPAPRLRAALGSAALDAWPAFAESWDRLELDTYMADGGRYRRRRYATLSAAATGDALVIEPEQPHYQSLDYNRLNGGIARHFAPIEAALLAAPTLPSVLHLGLGLFRQLHPQRAAHIEVHQFRIEARADALGRPTPEGAHRDGVDFVLVMMVARVNVGSGTTEIFDPAGRRIDSFTLVEPGDTALVDDRRALHGVTPIVPLDATRAAWRDVLVATYRCIEANAGA
jgi:hypothetical protein